MLIRNSRVSRLYDLSDIIFLMDSPNPLWAIALLRRKAALVCSPSFPQLTAHSLRQSVQPQQSSQFSYTENCCYCACSQLLRPPPACTAAVIIELPSKSNRKKPSESSSSDSRNLSIAWVSFLLLIVFTNIGWALAFSHLLWCQMHNNKEINQKDID